MIYKSIKKTKIFVTSNLYIPKNLIRKAPGILFVCGHTKEAKAYPEYQKVCIDLVLNGFVVLVIDPLGQGERMQYCNPKTKKRDVEWGTTEHSYAGFQCIICGSSIARYFIWDGIRGIDYLISRDEVDKNKIGVTGNSGGGTQTSYLMMIDTRIKCAIPCSYITSRYEYMKTGQEHDAEQNIFGAIKNGINHDDFITAMAPKPVQIGANAYDFFCIEGTIKSYERAKKIYSLYNATKKLRLVISKTTHSYSDKLRQETVNWFKYHLKGEKMDFATNPNIKTEKIQDLNCTPNGQILDKFPNSTTVFILNKNYKPLDKYIFELNIALCPAAHILLLISSGF
ncbi:MAG: prolyl oligopeptidase family serine peptidase [Candidatus Firestonebacteria bacterium]